MKGHGGSRRRHERRSCRAINYIDFLPPAVDVCGDKVEAEKFSFRGMIVQDCHNLHISMSASEDKVLEECC